ncbi:hypothetical protein GJ496_008234 [Pomphorhynchus laevis]|nr:hypothetical protein GJ496_008234 [Pomphorhynchus laevis]
MSKETNFFCDANTFEIDIPLTQTNNSSYTEVSIFDMVRNNEHTLRLLLDPFNVYPEERTNELLRVIKESDTLDTNEDKTHTDWLADNLGEGYDKDDPFIDDSEAPQDVLQMTTKLGGFYVNKGNVELMNQLTDQKSENDNNNECIEIPTLPEQVPEMLRLKIEQFVQLYTYLEDKEYIWVYEPALKLLRLIDNGSFNLSSTLRGRILSYLSYELQIKKALLLKKLRQIRCHPPNCAGDNLVQAMNKLRSFVDNEMPKQIKEREDRIAYMCNNNPIIINRIDAIRNPIIENEPPRVKKRYRWGVEDRNYFKELMKIRLSKLSSEDNVFISIRDFLENTVKPMWPKGWMTTNSLIRECKLFLPENIISEAKKRKMSPPHVVVSDDNVKSDENHQYQRLNNTFGEEADVIFIPRFKNDFNLHENDVDVTIIDEEAIQTDGGVGSVNLCTNREEFYKGQTNKDKYDKIAFQLD